MNRRGFLKFLPAAVGGLALAEAIPFSRVWSFPSKIEIAQPATLRFVRAYDPIADRAICRLDVLYGFSTIDPLKSIENGYEQMTVRESRLQDALDSFAERFGVPGGTVPQHMFAREGRDPQIRGIHWYPPLPVLTPA